MAISFIPGLSGYGSLPASVAYRNLQKTGDAKNLQAVRSAPEVQRTIERFEKKLEKMKTVDDFFKDREAVAFVLSAFGLDSEINNMGRIKKVLTESFADPKALVNRLNDPRFGQMARALNMGGQGLGRLKDSVDQLSNQYNLKVTQNNFFITQQVQGDNTYNLLTQSGDVEFDAIGNLVDRKTGLSLRGVGLDNRGNPPLLGSGRTGFNLSELSAIRVPSAENAYSATGNVGLDTILDSRAVATTRPNFAQNFSITDADGVQRELRIEFTREGGTPGSLDGTLATNEWRMLVKYKNPAGEFTTLNDLGDKVTFDADGKLTSFIDLAADGTTVNSTNVPDATTKKLRFDFAGLVFPNRNTAGNDIAGTTGTATNFQFDFTAMTAKAEQTTASGAGVDGRAATGTTAFVKTELVELNIQLNKRETGAARDVNFSQDVTVYDTLGQRKTIKMEYFKNDGENSYTVQAKYYDPFKPGDVGTILNGYGHKLNFDNTGKISSAQKLDKDGVATATYNANWAGGLDVAFDDLKIPGSPAALQLSVDFGKLVSRAENPYAEVPTHDSIQLGKRQSVKIEENGIVRAYYDNGRKIDLFMLATAPVNTSTTAGVSAYNMGGRNAGGYMIIDEVAAGLEIRTSGNERFINDPATGLPTTTKYPGVGRGATIEATLGGAKTESFLTQLKNQFVKAEYEKALGRENPSLREAKYFQERASQITSGLDLLGDQVMRKVASKVLGLPDQLAVQSVETQMRVIERRIDVKKFQDPKFVDRFIQQYLSLNEQTGNSVSQSQQWKLNLLA